MISAPDPGIDIVPATDGDIAIINLESARQQSWGRFWRAPERPGIAECIVEQEQLTVQFVGDLAAFDRLETPRLMTVARHEAVPSEVRGKLNAAEPTRSPDRLSVALSRRYRSRRQ